MPLLSGRLEDSKDLEPEICMRCIECLEHTVLKDFRQGQALKRLNSYIVAGLFKFKSKTAHVIPSSFNGRFADKNQRQWQTAMR